MEEVLEKIKNFDGPTESEFARALDGLKREQVTWSNDVRAWKMLGRIWCIIGLLMAISCRCALGCPCDMRNRIGCLENSFVIAAYLHCTMYIKCALGKFVPSGVDHQHQHQHPLKHHRYQRPNFPKSQYPEALQKHLQPNITMKTSMILASHFNSENFQSISSTGPGV